MTQLDFWNESCPECDAGIPFVHPAYSIGIQNPRAKTREVWKPEPARETR